MRNPSNCFKRFLTISVLYFLSACGGDQDTGVVAPPSIGDGNEVSTNGFWVRGGATDFTTYTASEDGFGSECVFRATDLLGEKNCYLDVLELDLNFNPLDIQFNVPPDMCQYFAITPSWHWNFSSGIGPRRVEVTIRDGVTRSCNAQLRDGTNVSCADHPELVLLEGRPECVYDHSNFTDSGSPNCCVGQYELITNTEVETDTGVETSTTQEFRSWGDSFQGCIGGPVNTGFGTLTDIGYPATEIRSIPGNGGAGLNDRVTIASNIATIATRFSYGSTFYTEARHTHDGYIDPRQTQWPYAFDPVDDLDGDPFGSLTLRIPRKDGYLFECLDEGRELKYSINLRVREWNTVSDFLAFGSSQGATYNPDVIGQEGVDCDGIGGDCNDYFDFDDLLRFNGNNYDTNPPSPGDNKYLIRNSYFPRINY